VAVGIAALGSAQSEIRTFGVSRGIKAVYASDAIYIAFPAQTVPMAGVESVTWSGDGKFLLLVRKQDRKQLTTIDDVIDSLIPQSVQAAKDEFGIQLEAFNLTSGQTKVIWHGQVPNVYATSVQAVGKHATFCVVLTRSDEEAPGPVVVKINGSDRTFEQPIVHSWAMLVDAESSKWSFVSGLENKQGSITSLSSPTTAAVLLSFKPQESLESKSSGGQPTELPLSEMVSGQGQIVSKWPVFMSQPEWLADGKRFCWQNRVPNSRKWIYLTLNDQGQPVELGSAKPSCYQAPVDSPPVMPVEVAYRPSDPYHLARVSGLYLHSVTAKSSRDVLLSAGAHDPVINPTHDAVLFSVDHTLRTVRIVKAPADSLDRLKKALKWQAISYAKQAGLATIMYAGDNDDQYPSGKESISPYLKSDDILDGFVYTLSGNLNASQIESPAETVMGYVEGPGGRAVVYTDGHSKWINDPG
jgi:hypothetical protein